jgi:hypothetical protein
MADEDHSEAIALLTALTGTDASTAEQYLEACDFDVTEVRQHAFHSFLQLNSYPCARAKTFRCAHLHDYKQAFNMFSAVGPPSTTEAPSASAGFASPGATTAPSGGDGLQDQDAADAAMAAALAEEGQGFEYDHGGPGHSGYMPSPSSAARPSRATGGRAAARDARPSDEEVAYEAQHGMRRPQDYTTSRMVDFDGPFGSGGSPFGGGGVPPHFPGFRGGGIDPSGFVSHFEGGRANDHARALSAASLAGGPGGFTGGMRMGGRMGAAAQVLDVPDSEWMFPLPLGAKRANCGGDVGAARSLARDRHKWVLVCLAAMDTFDSHKLNRDVWGNESLLELMQTSFVFWHRTTASPQGQAFQQLYQVETPHKVVRRRGF